MLTAEIKKTSMMIDVEVLHHIAGKKKELESANDYLRRIFKMEPLERKQGGAKMGERMGMKEAKERKERRRK